MDSTNILNIEGLQLKRILGTNAYNKYKNNTFNVGELIYTDTAIKDTNNNFVPIITLILNPNVTLETHITNGSYMVLKKDLDNILKNSIEDNLSNGTPSDIVTIPASAGDSKQAARAGHTHRITGDAIQRATSSNPNASAISLRKIFAGTDTPDNSKGSNGDIYIKY